MTGLLAQAEVKGPEINWEALSPAIALTAGACIVLLVGLARSAFIRRGVVAFLTLAMPGSANFAGEFLILLGTFDSVQAIAIIASIGVVLASVYALRMYIRSMHNRVGPKVTSFDLTFGDGLVLVPLIVAIIAFAVYPQLALESGEEAIKSTVQAVAQR